MLKGLRHHQLLVDTVELLVDVTCYVAIMLAVLLLLGQLANVAL